LTFGLCCAALLCFALGSKEKIATILLAIFAQYTHSLAPHFLLLLSPHFFFFFFFLFFFFLLVLVGHFFCSICQLLHAKLAS